MKWSKPQKSTRRCRLDCGDHFFIIENPLENGKKSYQLEYWDAEGNRKWERMDKKLVTDRESAYKEHWRIRGRLAEVGTPKPLGTGDTFFDCVGIYLKDKQTDNLRSYINIEWMVLNCIVPFFGQLLLRDITSQTIKDFLTFRRETVSDSTIKNELAHLKEIFNLMIEQEYYSGVNPVNFRRLKLQIFQREVRMTHEQEKVIWPLLEKYPPMLDLADFLFNTCMRPGNILSLTWDRINWDKKEAFIPKELHKQKKRDGHYMLNSKVIDMLKRRKKANDENGKSSLVFVRYEEGKPKEVQMRWLEIRWKRVTEEAGIEDLHFYDLKHTRLSRIAREGASIFQLKAISNHASTSSLERYIKNDEVRKSAREYLE